MVFEDRVEQMRKTMAVVLLALLAAVLVWLTLSSWQAEQSRREAQTAEVQTLTLLRSTDRVLRSLQNAETGQRGYLLTRDPAFLKPMRAAQADLPIALETLRELTLDDAKAAGPVKRIEELSLSRMQQLERGLVLFDRRAFNTPGLTAHLRNGKQAMDALRHELAGLEGSTFASLRHSQSLARHHEALASKWRTLITLFTLVLSVVCGCAIIGLLRARRDARDQAIRAKSNIVIEAGRHLLQSIIDSSPNAIFVKTRNGEILFANTGFRKICPGPLEELRGIPVPPVDDANEAALLAQADRAALERGERSQVDLTLCIDGKMRSHNIEKNPWIRNGEIIGVIGIVRDISEIKSREAELERRVAARTAQLESALATAKHEMTEREAAQDALRQLQKIESLGQLTGGIAHDFNNMLAVVISSLDTVRHRLPHLKPGELATLIETALAGATSGADLTARLLAFARQQRLDPSPVELNQLMLSTRQLLDRTIDKRVEIALDLDPAAGWVEVDNSQLENALLNLAVNARDAMPSGGRLAISTRRRGDRVEILVDDTGLGMTAEQLSRVFDPFFTTKEAGVGTGLGMSQVHGFVAQSGGEVTIKSAPNKGTCVCISLPTCAAPAARTPDAKVPETRKGRGELVLIVEDEALVRIASQTSLKALGYNVIDAANGYEALELLETRPDIAAMITDVSMPMIDGRDLAKAARLLRPGLPVLLTTGHEQQKSASDDLPVLTKPYLLDRLAEMLARLLDRPTDREPQGAAGNSPHHGATDKEQLSSNC